MIRELRAHLANDPGVSALVGFRIQPVGEGEGSSLPRISYLIISRVPQGYSHDGPSGVVTTRVQLNCYAANEGDAEALSEAVRLCLDGRSGYWGQVRIGLCKLDNLHGDYQPDPIIYQRILDFLITHSEVTS